MIANIGFYLTFIFKLAFMGIVSLLLGYFLRKKDNHLTLKSYTSSSLSVVAFIAIIDQYSSENSSEIMTFAIPLAFAFLFFVEKESSNKFNFKFSVFLCSSIFIGLGYYLSAISFIFISIVFNFLSDGVFDFFDPKFHEEKNNSDDISSENINILDKE